MFIKKFSILLLAFVMVFSFVGCSANQAEEVNEPSNTDPQNEDTNTVENTTKTITDMAGREVTIPSEINKVYATHSIGTIFVYTLAPEKVAGWTYELEADKQFIKEEYHDLPVLGRWKGTNSTNIEEILKVKPDIIINMGDVDEKYISESDEIEDLLGIPVIMVDGSLTNQAESYEFLGNILGEEERAKELADYSREVLDEINEESQTIEDNEKVRVFYAAGTNGLDTYPNGSINSEVLDLVGGVNVAESGLDSGIRRMEASIEELINWNPELVIMSSNSSHNPELYNHIMNDASWSNINAVKNNEVYEIPYGPYDWFSQPPTLMRTMGLQWLGDLLYPDVYQINIEQETKEFFNLFFDYQMTDDEVEQLIGNSIRK